MWDHLNFAYDAPKGTAQNWITVNQTLQSQTKACITWHRVVILHQSFGTTYQSHLCGSRNPKEKTQHHSS